MIVFVEEKKTYSDNIHPKKLFLEISLVNFLASKVNTLFTVRRSDRLKHFSSKKTFDVDICTIYIKVTIYKSECVDGVVLTEYQ